jgi:hypothetical protein
MIRYALSLNERQIRMENPSSTAPVTQSLTEAISWKASVNINQFSVAISLVHQQRNQTVSYEEPCGKCREAFERDNRVLGCLPHLRKPRLFTQGNVTLALSVADCMKQCHVDRENYSAQGDSPLSPEELIGLRKYLLSENTVVDWHAFTHILFDIKLSLRDKKSCRF